MRDVRRWIVPDSPEVLQDGVRGRGTRGEAESVRSKAVKVSGSVARRASQSSILWRNAPSDKLGRGKTAGEQGITKETA